MKIGVIILARANFGRWPDKVLFELQGKSILEHVITKAQQLNVDCIIVSTTANPEDKPIREIIVKTNCDSSLGDPDNRTSRICQAIKDYELDYVVDLSPARPFFDVEYENRLINAFHQNPGYEIYKVTYFAFNCVPPIFNARIPFQNQDDDQEIYMKGEHVHFHLYDWYAPEIRNRYLFNANIAYKIQGDNHQRICEYLGHFPKDYDEVTKALLEIGLW